MKYLEALDYIFSYPDYEKALVPHKLAYYDLRRVEELLARLGNPHRKANAVHIAGTNGKGSIAAMIASALTAAGYITGLYTSPHLNTIRERFRVDGKLITEDEFTIIVGQLKPEVDIVNQQANYGKLTTFELLTALAFSYFALKGANFQVLEVGMGGRFDATNVIQPEVSVVSSISLDHTQVLGSSVAQIAAEKAGIIKPQTTVVISPQPNEATRIIKKACLQQKVRLIEVGKDITYQGIHFDYRKQLLRVNGRLSSYELTIPLLGDHQLENAATAVASLEVLADRGFNISRDNITDGLARVNWPGRFQILHEHPLLVVDGAHNPDSAAKLTQAITQYLDFKRATLIIGVSIDKDINSIASVLLPRFDEVIVTRSRHPRAVAPHQLADSFAQYGIKTRLTKTTSEALSLALSLARESDLICVTGSLFVVAEVMEAVT
ncbi:MAG: bifunctional folylpolyglutamate synthase/dihydrofolate synthase [Dehalococcoidales bacterium]|nr:bifunctional folylpolyglutamate synthase/dihydrofolate synthase [Dehalococcoidales bacterium]